MPVDWKEFNRLFDPFARLAEDELEAFYIERRRAPWRQVLDRLETEPAPERVRVLLAGARGTGKTTELLRLAAELGEDGSAFCPVLLDVFDALPDGAGVLPLLALVGVALRRTADDWAGGSVQSAGGGGSDKLAEALRRWNVPEGWLEAAVQAVGAFLLWGGASPEAAAAGVAGARLLKEIAFTGLGREDARQDEESVKELLEAIRDELDRLAKANGGRTAVLLLDGLDKRPTREALAASLEDADLLLDIPAAVVLTGPMQLRTDPRYAMLQVAGEFEPITLHNVPVLELDGGAVREHEEGIGLLVDLYRRRAEALPGGAELLEEVLVRRMARASSGVVREFLAFTKEAGRYARLDGKDRIDAAAVDEALAAHRKDLQTVLDEDRWAILQRVHETRRLVGGELGYELLMANLIACYPNGDVWFRPHELLVPSLERARR